MLAYRLPTPEQVFLGADPLPEDQLVEGGVPGLSQVLLSDQTGAGSRARVELPSVPSHK